MSGGEEAIDGTVCGAPPTQELGGIDAQPTLAQARVARRSWTSVVAR